MTPRSQTARPVKASWQVAALVVFIGVVAAGFAAGGTNGNGSGGSHGGGSSSDGLFINLDETGVFSRTLILKFEGEVVRFDTATGAVARFVGNLSGSNAGGAFYTFIKPVVEPTSGFLQIQKAGGGVFLVDVVFGDTWVLRTRGKFGQWELVRVAQSVAGS